MSRMFITTKAVYAFGGENVSFSTIQDRLKVIKNVQYGKENARRRVPRGWDGGGIDILGE